MNASQLPPCVFYGVYAKEDRVLLKVQGESVALTVHDAERLADDLRAAARAVTDKLKAKLRAEQLSKDRRDP